MSPLSSPCQQTLDHFSSTYKLGYSYSYNNKFHKTRLCHFLVQNIWAIAEKNCTFFCKKNFVRIPVATPTLINYIYLRSAINTLYLQHIKSSIFRTFKIVLECLLIVFSFIKIDRVIVTQVGFCVISRWPLTGFLSNHKKALLR